MAKLPAERYEHPFQLLDHLRFVADRMGLPVPAEGSVDEVGSHYSLAVSLLEFGNLEDAFKHITIVVNMRPDYFAGWNYMGVILKEMGRYGEAIAAIKRSLQLKPDNDRAWSNLGLALAGADDLDEAIEAHREAMRLAPDNPVNIANAASCLTALEKWPEIIELCQSAVLRFPRKASLWMLGGQALLFVKRTREGQDWLRRAIELDPARKAQILEVAHRFGVEGEGSTVSGTVTGISHPEYGFHIVDYGDEPVDCPFCDGTIAIAGLTGLRYEEVTCTRGKHAYTTLHVDWEDAQGRPFARLGLRPKTGEMPIGPGDVVLG